MNITKTPLIKYYENKETTKSKSFCLHKTGFRNKIQIDSNLTDSKALLQVNLLKFKQVSDYCCLPAHLMLNVDTTKNQTCRADIVLLGLYWSVYFGFGQTNKLIFVQLFTVFCIVLLLNLDLDNNLSNSPLCNCICIFLKLVMLHRVQ